MAYQLTVDEPVADAVRRLCAEQIDAARAQIDGAGDRHEAVHEVRKGCKKIRAVLRLAHGELGPDGTYRSENAWYRDVARSLSDLRDTQALVETCDGLLAEPGDERERSVFGPVRALLVERRRRADEGADLERLLGEARARLEAARDRLAGWPLVAAGWPALAPGFQRSYRRARAALATADSEPTAEAFHEWRKRVKEHWYHCRLLAELWPPVMAARRDQADLLADLLGQEHDLTVFRDQLAALRGRTDGGPSGVEGLLDRAARRRTWLRAEVLPLGRLLLAERPKQLSRRFGVYWAVWRGEQAID